MWVDMTQFCFLIATDVILAPFLSQSFVQILHKKEMSQNNEASASSSSSLFKLKSNLESRFPLLPASLHFTLPYFASI